MKQLLNRFQYRKYQYRWNEVPEGEAAAPTPVIEKLTETNTSQVEAAATSVGRKGINITPEDLPVDPDIQAAAADIQKDWGRVAGTLTSESKDDTLPPETAKTLGDRGINVAEFKDRTIGGKSEAAMMVSFLEQNPDIDAKTLVEATGNMFSQMTPEQQAQALAKMTAEEYKAFLETAKERLENPIDTTLNTYPDSETGEEVTEDNQFDLKSILEGAGVTGNRAPTSSSSGNTYPGNFDVPNISNTELMAQVETLATQIGANPAALKAVVAVESGGNLSATRFEPQHASKGRDEATSFGAFQIMGFNATSLGYSSATDMKQRFESGGAPEQVKAFGEFLKTRNLVPHIAANQEPNFRAFASGYNGTGYAKLNYHGKMAAAYARYNQQLPIA